MTDWDARDPLRILAVCYQSLVDSMIEEEGATRREHLVRVIESTCDAISALQRDDSADTPEGATVSAEGRQQGEPDAAPSGLFRCAWCPQEGTAHTLQIHAFSCRYLPTYLRDSKPEPALEPL